MEEDIKNNVRLHAFVEGHVQGVGFRYYVYTKANDLGVTGWVRNTYHGQVEVVAEAQQKTLETLLIHIRRGPSAMAFVSKVTTRWLDATGEFKDFDITHTV